MKNPLRNLSARENLGNSALEEQNNLVRLAAAVRPDVVGLAERHHDRIRGDLAWAGRRIDERLNKWLSDLPGAKARAKILVRIQRLEAGNPGDVKDVGEGISEMRIDHGPGYRVYYKRIGEEIFLILCGGDKDSQEKDIKRAKKIASELKEKVGDDQGNEI